MEIRGSAGIQKRSSKVVPIGTLPSHPSVYIRGIATCYTARVDDRPVIWDRANRKHIVEDHPERVMSVAEVEHAMTDPSREEAPDRKRDGYWLVRGKTSAGRRLLVAWVEFRGGRYPVHAHAIGRRGR